MFMRQSQHQTRVSGAKTTLCALGSSRGKQWLNYPCAQYLEGDAAYLHRPLGCVTSAIHPELRGQRCLLRKWTYPLLYVRFLLSTNCGYGSKLERVSEEMIHDPLSTTL